jgi:rhodanese-related sulfurtransferase
MVLQNNLKTMLNNLKAMFGNLFQSAGNSAYSNISQADFQQKLNEKNVVVLDVRTSMEFRSGHIPGAINADIMSAGFREKVQKLDKNKTLLVYCKSGGRSSSACGQLSGLGFTNVYNLSGGVMSYYGKLV